jgi:murein DD-endopeptidase MepM/ murein hydrolase activator NlpD
VDIAAPTGTPVVAAEAGRVSAANYSATAGNLVHIEHAGGFQTRYFHLSRSVVGVGANVARGQLIGYVGSTGRSTGPHLHWEVRRGGVALDPVAAMQGGASAPNQLPPAGFGWGGFSTEEVIAGAVGLVLLALILRR